MLGIGLVSDAHPIILTYPHRGEGGRKGPDRRGEKENKRNNLGCRTRKRATSGTRGQNGLPHALFRQTATGSYVRHKGRNHPWGTGLHVITEVDIKSHGSLPRIF